MKKQTLRIIGGRHKRRQIAFADVDGLRPTPDRLRETLFNWLMYDVTGAHVLDVCAGSGILGFEALSRGAAHCTLIEPHKKQFTMLQKNAAMLGCSAEITLINQQAEVTLSQLTQPYTLIFLDPPYALNLWQPLFDMLLAQNLMAADGCLYVEADRPHAEVLTSNQLIREKETKVGQIHAGLYRLASQ